MEVGHFDLFLKIGIGIITFTTLIFAIFKKARKRITDTLLRDIDEKSPDCFAMQAIKLSNDNSKNIDKIIGKVDSLCDKIDGVTHTLEEMSDRLERGDVYFNDLIRGNIRLEILRFIDHDPEEVTKISELYDKYKAMSGNSYIDLVFKNYLKEHSTED